jgi:hypothetical protein
MVNLFTGLQDRTETTGVIAIERKLGWLVRCECGCALEADLIDHYSDFERKGHEINESFQKFVFTAGKEKHTGQ